MRIPGIPALLFSVTMLILFSSSTLMSNGGPVDTSTLESCGNIQLKKAENIALVSEKLFIKPVSDFVEVHVVYELNCTEENRTVEYGFPFLNEFGYDLFRSFKDKGNSIVPYFSMKLNGADVRCSEKLTEVNKPDRDEKDEVKWFLSQLALHKGNNTIEISYTVRSSYNDDATSKSKYTEYGKRNFKYNFTPAAGWGKGTVDRLEITVDTSVLELKNAEVYVKEIRGMKKQDNIYHVIIEKADIAKLKDMFISYDLSKYYLSFAKQVEHNRASKSIKSINASSSLKGDYQPARLIDGNFSTGWSEGADKQGIGEWVEVEFNEGSNIRSIAIANGFWRSRELFMKNSRLKTVQCDIQARRKDGSTYNISKTVTMNDRPATDLYGDDPVRLDRFWDYQFDEWIDTSTINLLAGPEDLDCDCEITKIRLTIKDVYPGLKFEDTCITELFAF